MILHKASWATCGWTRSAPRICAGAMTRRRTHPWFAAFRHPDELGYRGLAYGLDCLHATEP